MATAHRSVRGRIAYTSRKPELFGQSRGHEEFLVTYHTDGAVTVRAHCLITEPAPDVLRDVTFTTGADGRPQDCYVRIRTDDAFAGSGWVTFDDAAIHCESMSGQYGRLSQTFDVSDGYDGFATHPIVADGLLALQMRPSDGPRRQPFRMLLPSGDHRGASAPLIVDARMTLEYLGVERVRIALGEFETHHYRFSDDGRGMPSAHGGYPPYDLWVMTGPEGILVQAGVGGYMATWYELVAFAAD